MDRATEKLCDRIEATGAEFRLRRQIELCTGRTPEMLAEYAKRRPLTEYQRTLLEAWQDAAEMLAKL